jgi:hypothetical protein
MHAALTESIWEANSITAIQKLFTWRVFNSMYTYYTIDKVSNMLREALFRASIGEVRDSGMRLSSLSTWRRLNTWGRHHSLSRVKLSRQLRNTLQVKRVEQLELVSILSTSCTQPRTCLHFSQVCVGLGCSCRLLFLTAFPSLRYRPCC